MDPVDEAARLAFRSDMLQRHGAVITHHGVIVGRGFNERTVQFAHTYSIHAEVAAIMNLRKCFPVEMRNKKWIRECRLYVVRIGPDSKGNPLRNSLPCVKCANCIKSVGIPIVFYSSEP